MLDLNFFGKYYVGFRKETDHELLGFATQMEDNTAFQKRKETVEHWRDNNIETITLDNKPRHGFKIVNSVSRFTTSNKLFRIEDPMGFQLEISAANLFDVISNCAVIQGNISEKMVWARQGPNHYLIRGDSEEYKNFLDGPVKFKLKAGMLLTNVVGNVIYRYEGSFYCNMLETENKEHGLTSNGGYRYHGQQNYIKNVSIYRDPKPYHIYTQFVFDDNGDINERCFVEMRRGVIPKLTPSDYDGDLIKGYFETEKWIGQNYENRVTSQRYSDAKMFFDDRKTATDVVYQQHNVADMVTDNYRNCVEITYDLT